MGEELAPGAFGVDARACRAHFETKAVRIGASVSLVAVSKCEKTESSTVSSQSR